MKYFWLQSESLVFMEDHEATHAGRCRAFSWCHQRIIGMARILCCVNIAWFAQGSQAFRTYLPCLVYDGRSCYSLVEGVSLIPRDVISRARLGVVTI